MCSMPQTCTFFCSLLRVAIQFYSFFFFFKFFIKTTGPGCLNLESAFFCKCISVALPIYWPLLWCIIPALFAYSLACHPYIFFTFLMFLFSCSYSTVPGIYDSKQTQGRREDCWGPGQIQKVGPIRGGSGGTPPGNFAILHALKCVLGASEAPFRACIHTAHTYLPVAVFV